MLPRRNQAENQGKIEFFRDLVLNLTQIRFYGESMATQHRVAVDNRRRLSGQSEELRVAEENALEKVIDEF
jgi:hypothetical protein